MRLLLVLLLLTACGKDDDGDSGSSTPEPWTSNERVGFLTNCSDVLIDNYDFIGKQASAACECILLDAESRWSYDDYAANEAKYTAQQTTEGITQVCREKGLAAE